MKEWLERYGITREQNREEGGETTVEREKQTSCKILLRKYILKITYSTSEQTGFSQICDNQNQGYSRFFSAKIKAISRSFLKFSFSQ